MAGYHLENFGCRASRSDGEAIAADLRHHGLSQSDEFSTASVVVVNTCSVTEEADRTARAFIRRVHHHNPKARIVVTGCYAQRAPEEIAQIKGVTSVIGNSHKSLVVPGIMGSSDFVPLTRLVNGVPILHDENFAHTELSTLSFAEDAHQTRPNLKVQDGCANRCSFCIIPETRGPSRSIALTECLDAVNRFAESGGQELVLSGINLGRWGRDLRPQQCFSELVAAILDLTQLPRLRLSSIEPMDWTTELLALFAQYAPTGRLAQHAHLPLQSGSDTILRTMHRRYRPWHYEQKVRQIYSLMPDAAIGADVMIGFPGETDSLFQESYDFIAAQPFTYLHLFPYSARPGTPAADLHRSYAVPPRTVKERMTTLRELATKKNRIFRESFIGKELSAVTLEPDKTRKRRAISSNFVKIEVETKLPANRTITVQVTGLSEDGLRATLYSA